MKSMTQHRASAWLAAVALVTLVTLVTLVSGTSRAQDLEFPQPRQGYYVGLALNGVLWSGHEMEDGRWQGPWAGPTGSLRGGQRIFDWLDIGLSLGAGAAIDDDYWALVGHISLEAQLRPIDPLFIRPSVGFGFADVTRRKKGIDGVIGQVGGAYSLAVGYDFFPGRKDRSGGLALTPVVGIEVGPGEALTTLTGWIGFEITWWTGLPREQLILDDKEAYR